MNAETAPKYTMRRPTLPGLGEGWYGSNELDDGFDPVRKRWLQWSKGLGQTIEVRLDKETLSGTFADLDEDGALILEVEGGGRRRISAGDVYFAAE